MLKLLSYFKREKAAPARRPHRTSSIRAGLPKSEADWARERSPPCEQDLVLSDHVLVWLNQLPQPVRPSALCAHYPRVANRIALCWSDARLTEQLFETFLVSHRGRRQGFPPKVADELLLLRVYHGRRHQHTRGAQTWDSNLLAVSDR